MPDTVTGTEGSVADSLRAAFAEREKTTTESTTADAGGSTEPASTEVATDPASGPKIDATGRAHAQDGKFTAKPGETMAVEGAQTTTAAQTGTDPAKTTPAAPAAPAIDPIDAPVHWDKASKEAFAKVSPDVQRLWVDQQRRMDAAHTQRSQELAERGRSVDGLMKALEPRRRAAALEGTTPEAQVEGLFALSDFAKQDGLGFARWFIQQKGFTAADVFGVHAQGGGQAGSPDLDPRFAALERQNQVLTQQLQQVTGHLSTREQANQRQAEDSVLREIDKFRGAKDATGAYEFPHYDAVEDAMATLIPLIRQANPQASIPDVLRTAYDQAVWANPDTRAVVQLSQQRKMESDRAAQERARAAEAKTKATSITGSPGGSGAPMEFASVQDELRARFAGLTGGGRL